MVKPGDPIRAEDINRLERLATDALTGFLTASTPTILGRILGPTDPIIDELDLVDYTDERYWAVSSIITNADAAHGSVLTFGDHAADNPGRVVLTATNLSEVDPTVSARRGGHLVPPGMLVTLGRLLDNSTPRKFPRFIFNRPMDVFLLKVQSVSGTTFPKTYTLLPWVAGSTYGISRNGTNDDESNYDAEIVDSYDNVPSGAIVTGWWDYVAQQYAFTRFGNFENYSTC